jgi:hypothetical protein
VGHLYGISATLLTRASLSGSMEGQAAPDKDSRFDPTTYVRTALGY